ncbi:MAG: hypothetical protein LBF97_05745 [Elusimicrobiota bacterium]|nr:hypothetical protein [Elusimicrobiota bacterium]
MSVFKKKYLLDKTEINEEDSELLRHKKMIIRFLFETGLRAFELFNIVSINNKVILVKGKGNKLREVFHNIQTTSKITHLNITTKTLRI